LSEKEREYVRFHDRWTVRDRQQIKAFAHHISQGTYGGKQSGKTETRATIIGYRGIFRKVSFAVHGMSITTESNSVFAYPPRFLSLTSLDPLGLKPLQARWTCGRNLSSLIYLGFWRERDPRRHLDPDQWCDTIVKHFRSEYIIHGELNSNKEERMFPDAAIARRFTCPSAHAATDGNDAHSQPHETNPSSQTPDTWISDYAMNSNCTEDSPEDMVFLFESKPGWNQHGGLELFTFDNHDPRGGLVLLNGGDVKFIRTEEELKQLRWK
jgi:hypothetical protein